jgi:hypothetical protein
MSFYPFNEVAQEVTTARDSPAPVASALAQANWSRPLDFWPPQATTPPSNLNQPAPHYFSSHYEFLSCQ